MHIAVKTKRVNAENLWGQRSFLWGLQCPLPLFVLSSHLVVVTYMYPLPCSPVPRTTNNRHFVMGHCAGWVSTYTSVWMSYFRVFSHWHFHLCSIVFPSHTPPFPFSWWPPLFAVWFKVISDQARCRYLFYLFRKLLPYPKNNQIIFP